jgi:hypothetical protein
MHTNVRLPPLLVLSRVSSKHTSLSPALPVLNLCRHGLYKQLALKFGAGAARKEAAAAAAATSITAAAAAAAMSDSAAEAEAALAFAGVRPVMHIATVGAQLRSLDDTAEAMCWAAGVTPSGRKLPEEDHRPHADALLLVSGSHPVRQLPMASQLLTGSVSMLQRGTQLKQQGVLPPQLELWAVANPVTERDASYTEQKVRQAPQRAVASRAPQQAESSYKPVMISRAACVRVLRSTLTAGRNLVRLGATLCNVDRLCVVLRRAMDSAVLSGGCWCSGHPHAAALRLACL